MLTGLLPSSPVEVLLTLAGRGAEFRLTAEGLQFRPTSLATESERRVLLAARGRLAPALRWRLDAMRRQVPPAPIPIPILVARPNVRPQPGTCLSCGEAPLLPSAQLRCPLCALAAWIAVAAYEARMVG